MDTIKAKIRKEFEVTMILQCVILDTIFNRFQSVIKSTKYSKEIGFICVPVSKLNPFCQVFYKQIHFFFQKIIFVPWTLVSIQKS